MVGDSFEDVECGNAAGTATCLVAGGGNEAPGSNVSPPPGAIPTITVHSLSELKQILEESAPTGNPELDTSHLGFLGWPASAANQLLDPSTPGAPAQGLDFVDFLLDYGFIRTASCSFPRMGAAAGGLASCTIGGNKILHVGCGNGALTKMLASKGLQVVGVDADTTLAQKRGLQNVQFQGAPLNHGCLSAAASRAPFDAVLLYAAGAGSVAAVTPQTDHTSWLTTDNCFARSALEEVSSVLTSGGRLCLELTAPPLHAGGMSISSSNSSSNTSSSTSSSSSSNSNSIVTDDSAAGTEAAKFVWSEEKVKAVLQDAGFELMAYLRFRQGSRLRVAAVKQQAGV